MKTLGTYLLVLLTMCIVLGGLWVTYRMPCDYFSRPPFNAGTVPGRCVELKR